MLDPQSGPKPALYLVAKSGPPRFPRSDAARYALLDALDGDVPVTIWGRWVVGALLECNPKELRYGLGMIVEATPLFVLWHRLRRGGRRLRRALAPWYAWPALFLLGVWSQKVRRNPAALRDWFRLCWLLRPWQPRAGWDACLHYVAWYLKCHPPGHRAEAA